MNSTKDNYFKPFKIGSTELKNRYVLAPMAGVSDVAVRICAARHHASLVYTEMISASALARDSRETLLKIRETQRDEAPLSLQLFGSRIEDIRKAIPILEAEARYSFLDFNLGCPVNKVMKQEAGSSMLKDLDNLYSLIREVVSLSHHPVTAKARIGYSDPKDCVQIVEALQEAGISAIAMHGRTRNEFYQGLPHYDMLKEAREVCKVTFIANGNIGMDNFQKVLEYTGADAVIIGRNAIGNPGIFEQMEQVELGETPEHISYERQKALFLELLDLEFSRPLPERKIASAFRTIAPEFFNSLPSSKKLRNLLVKCSSKQDYLNVIENSDRFIAQEIYDEDPGRLSQRG